MPQARHICIPIAQPTDQLWTASIFIRVITEIFAIPKLADVGFLGFEKIATRDIQVALFRPACVPSLRWPAMPRASPPHALTWHHPRVAGLIGVAAIFRNAHAIELPQINHGFPHAAAIHIWRMKAVFPCRPSGRSRDNYQTEYPEFKSVILCPASRLIYCDERISSDVEIVRVPRSFPAACGASSPVSCDFQTHRPFSGHSFGTVSANSRSTLSMSGQNFSRGIAEA